MPRTDRAEPPEWLDARHRALLGWAALGAFLTGGLAGLSVACLAFGANLWAAGLALAMLGTAPLLGVGPVLDWWRHRRPHRRRHRQRPEEFGQE
ncbi:hypothetical protein JYK14_21440 [Siccirubricoccus sp. KC 17139]|uniref:Uncharacterized protein n=1 Tax=Siccirubricoccus soli TaxID=2899147 RepID=A0ABT1D9U1_9PROT|nr:hypothetical protein [Siccirubricoccus soli]MCO6418701.1 hypothetical protein [Siccirubricoccus soli]MCP2684836.1 hypothetical protein [Siccirubricoccus soli]